MDKISSSDSKEAEASIPHGEGNSSYGEQWIKKRKELGRIILPGLLTDAYSQTLSPYCLTRNFLPAAFQPWAGSIFIIQPGQ